MFAGTMYEEEQFVGVVTKDEKEEIHNLNSFLEENGTVESHVHAHAQLYERSDFQFTIKEKFKKNDLEPLEEEVYFCEPKDGIFFDEESEDGKERQDEGLVSYLTSSEQPEDWIDKTSNEEMKSYVSNINTCGNVEWQDEMLKENGYQREDLKTKISSKAKRSNCFNANDYCVFTDGLNKGDEQLVKTVESM